MADNPSMDLPPHILIFPFPAQGHMLPLLDLTHQLALNQLAITIIITPKNLPILSPLLALHPCIHTKIFPFPHHPSIPPGVENAKDIGSHGVRPIASALSKLKQPIINWFNSHPNPPLALISDFFLGWTQALANQIGIPRIAFYSSGALLASVFHQVFTKPELTITESDNIVELDGLPGSPSFVYDHLPHSLRYRGSDPDWQFHKDGLFANFSSWGSVFNTTHELEADYLDYLKKVMDHSRVFAVGPLNLIGLTDRSVHENKDPIGILQWLDQRQDDSVLYVCFGSQKLLKKAQVDALAARLESSGVHFVWVVRSLTAHEISDGYGTIPDGFEERVSDRGLIVKGWAPQVQILGHRAIGTFLSHCGWNSVLETIAAGVMILAWPMGADQFVNARLLVDFLGAGFRATEGSDTVPDSALLAKVVGESNGNKTLQKFKINELRNNALAAIESGGSSMRDIHGLVKQLAQLQRKA